MKNLIISAIVIGVVHYTINGWWIGNTVRACNNPSSPTCQCLKSEARSSTLFYRSFFGNTQDEMLVMFRYCKGL